MKARATHVFHKHWSAVNLRCYYAKKKAEGEYIFCKKEHNKYEEGFTSKVDESKYKIEYIESEEIYFITDINKLKEFDNSYLVRRYRYIIHTGSSRSSKTWSLNQAMAAEAKKNQNITINILRDVMKDCRDLVEKDFLKFIRDPNARIKDLEKGKINNREFAYQIANESIEHFFIRNKSEHTYTTNGNSVITFTGADDENRIQGMGQDICWLNEPYKISRFIFDNLDQRTTQYMVLDWNPKEKHFINEIQRNPRAIVIHSTYRENPYCPTEAAAKIDSYEPTPINIKNGTADERMWKIYGLGIEAELPNKIFSGWGEIGLDAFNRLNYTSYYGLDWGQTNPTSIVEVKYDGDRTFYLNEILYKSETDMIYELKKEYGEDWSNKLNKKGLGIVSNYLDRSGLTEDDIIMCDSNKPDKIHELRREGYNAIAAKKGPGSVYSGISFMQRAKIYYTSTSKNILHEYNFYEWEIKKNINIEEPIKKDDHALDAIRYAITFLRDYLTIKL
jgi:PBSX family phage terminase large subunit